MGLQRSLVLLSLLAGALSLWAYRSMEADASLREWVDGFSAPEAARARYWLAEAGKGPNVDEVLERLAAALRVKTVSREAGVVSHPEGFLRLREMFEQHYPLLHAAAEREVFGGYSLMFRVDGTDASLKPAMFMAHLDVVPEGSELDVSRWDFEPFSGHLWTDPDDGRRYIYGRGTMDDKMSAVCLLEAVEGLLAGGFRPRRGLYLFFGHDEEVGGAAGARAAARELHRRGVRLHSVLDEGGVVGDGLFPGVPGRISLVGVGEKGYVDVELSAASAGGHSAAPPLPPTAVGRLSRALARLEGNQFAPNLDIMRDTVRHLGPAAPPLWRLAFSNLAAFRPLLGRALTGKSSTVAATVRTVISPTMLEGSEKANVLPTRARAVVNFRVMPPDTVASVVEHVRRVVGDPLVEVRQLRGEQGEDGPDDDPAPPSPVDGEAYRTIAATARQLWPDTPTAPIFCIGMTDSRHMSLLTDSVYRFIPYVANEDDIKRFHGISERVAVDDVERTLRFYRRLMLNMLS